MAYSGGFGAGGIPQPAGYYARDAPRAGAASTFSGVTILAPPGGKSSISLGGGYGDSQNSGSPNRATGSPMYGRRAAQQSAITSADHPHLQASPGPYPHPHQQSSSHSQQVPPVYGRRASAGREQAPDGYGQHQGTDAGMENERPQAVPPRRDNYGDYMQPAMGGKSIMQSPGGNSSVSLSWGAEPQYQQPAAPRWPLQEAQQPAHGYRNSAASMHATPEGIAHRGGLEHGTYVQHHMGGKNIMQSPGGTSSLSLAWNTPEANVSSPSRRPPLPAQHAIPKVGHAGTRDQYYMGGKNITQSPGGASTVDLSWGNNEHVRQTRFSSPHMGSNQHEAPAYHQAYGAPAAYQQQVEAARHHQDSYQQASPPSMKPLPQPYVPGRAMNTTSYSGVPIVQSPGGNQTFSIFG